MTFLRPNASYHCMQSLKPIRFVTCVGFTLSALLSAQTAPAQTNPAQTIPAQTTASPQAKPSAAAQTTSTLPATPPTAAPAPSAAQAPLTPSQEQPKRAQVNLRNGTLSVAADNSSLNQILRQISRETGIKITGGVVDERVFGQYGPAAPDQILAELLDGTASNMILVARDGATPAELILTPRQGGPTPPNPNAPAFDDSDRQDKPTEEAQPALEPPPSTSDSSAARNGTVPPITPAAPTSATPADTSQQDSPNGVKTPQQIYEQLQRLRTQTSPQ